MGVRGTRYECSSQERQKPRLAQSITGTVMARPLPCMRMLRRCMTILLELVLPSTLFKTSCTRLLSPRLRQRCMPENAAFSHISAVALPCCMVCSTDTSLTKVKARQRGSAATPACCTLGLATVAYKMCPADRLQVQLRLCRAHLCMQCSQRSSSSFDTTKLRSREKQSPVRPIRRSMPPTPSPVRLSTMSCGSSTSPCAHHAGVQPSVPWWPGLLFGVQSHPCLGYWTQTHL